MAFSRDTSICPFPEDRYIIADVEDVKSLRGTWDTLVKLVAA